MKKRKGIEKRGLLDKFNDLQTKGNVENSLIKSAADAVAGSVIGTGIGAITGDKAVFAGLGMIFLGSYLGDESGLLRVTGASTLAFGIAKAKEYQNNPDLDSAQKRLTELKDDWLTAFHLKWKKEEQDQSTESTDKEEKPIVDPVETKAKSSKEVSNSEVNGNVDIDLSALDEFTLEPLAMAALFKEEEKMEESDELDDENNVDFSQM